MRRVSKRILVDDQNQPVAVQIDYADWLEIERRLGTPEAERKPTDLSHWRGVIQLTEDPLEYQQRIRAEWD